MNFRFLSLFIPILIVTGCTSVDVKPAEDGWDQTENKGPGVFTGREGKFSFKVGQKDKVESSPSGQNPEPLSTPTDSNQPDASAASFQEFKEWQAWKKAKTNHADEYLEFRQWLEFKHQKSRQENRR